MRASVTQEDLKGWFNEVDVHPSHVFNCVETNVQLRTKSERILTEKGSRAAYKVVDASQKESVSLIFMYNAEGTRAPPMVLYPYKAKVPKTIIQNFPKGWGIGASDSGWMTIEAFYEYITNVLSVVIERKNSITHNHIFGWTFVACHCSSSLFLQREGHGTLLAISKCNSCATTSRYSIFPSI